MASVRLWSFRAAAPRTGSPRCPGPCAHQPTPGIWNFLNHDRAASFQDGRHRLVKRRHAHRVDRHWWQVIRGCFQIPPLMPGSLSGAGLEPPVRVRAVPLVARPAEDRAIEAGPSAQDLVPTYRNAPGVLTSSDSPQAPACVIWITPIRCPRCRTRARRCRRRGSHAVHHDLAARPP